MPGPQSDERSDEGASTTAQFDDRSGGGTPAASTTAQFGNRSAPLAEGDSAPAQFDNRSGPTAEGDPAPAQFDNRSGPTAEGDPAPAQPPKTTLFGGGKEPGLRAANAAPIKQAYTAAITAFVIWGTFPVYFHALLRVSALQVISHRVAWSLLFVLVWMYFRGEFGQLRAALTNRSVVLRLATSAALISVNWLAFVYGVAHGRVVEASLGYFIGPLVNVLLGVVVLSERLTPVQWTSVGMATLGVAYLTYITGGLPWIALTIAVSFSCYGFVRKVVKIEALPGLAMETLILTPLALGYLLWSEAEGVGSFGHTDAVTNFLLILSGPATAFTLYLFSYSARRLTYSTVGLLQYIAPSLQFASGLFILHEPFDHARLIGFVMIWAALVLYAGEGLRRSRRQQAPVTA